jgi:hypothetical protein
VEFVDWWRQLPTQWCSLRETIINHHHHHQLPTALELATLCAREGGIVQIRLAASAYAHAMPCKDCVYYTYFL